MQLLQAVNLILPKLGERQVTSLDARHPTLAVLLPIIDQNLTNVLRAGWWFNQSKTTLYPDNDGKILVGADCISFVPDGTAQYVVRDGRLYNNEDLTFDFTEPITGKITQRMQFDSLPDSAASYVTYLALVEAYTTDIGVSKELEVWQQYAARAYSEMLGEHLRQRKHTTKNTRQWRKFIGSLRS